MRKTFLGAAAALAVTVTSSQATSWNIQPFAEVPGAAYTQARAINDAGVIVGDTDTYGFIDDHGTRSVYTTVADSTLAAISNDGVLVGNGQVDSFIDDHGAITTVSVPGAAMTIARGISPNGRYVSGVYLSGVDLDESQGFILDRSTSTLTRVLAPSGSFVNMLQGINDEGIAVGNGGSANQGFVYDLGTGISTYYGSLNGFTHLHLRAVTDGGELAGWASGPTGTVGIIGTVAGGFSTLSFAQGVPAIEGLNDAGVAVGFWDDSNGDEHAFVATPLTAVPEPASWGLLLAGALVLAARRPRARRNAES